MPPDPNIPPQDVRPAVKARRPAWQMMLGVGVCVVLAKVYLATYQPNSVTHLDLLKRPWDAPLFVLGCAAAGIIFSYCGLFFWGRLAGIACAALGGLIFCLAIDLPILSYAGIFIALPWGLPMLFGAGWLFWRRFFLAVLLAFGLGWLLVPVFWEWGHRSLGLLCGYLIVSVFGCATFVRWLELKDNVQQSWKMRILTSIAWTVMILIGMWYGYAGNHWKRYLTMYPKNPNERLTYWLVEERGYQGTIDHFINGIASDIDWAVMARGGWVCRNMWIDKATSVGTIAPFRYCQSLKFMDRPISVPELQMAIDLPCILGIEFVNCQLTDEVLGGATVTANTTINDMRIENCPVTGQGFKGWSQSPMNRLAILNCPITDEGCRALAGFPQLTLLECNGTKVRRPDFSQIPDLTSVELNNCPIDDNDLAQIRCPQTVRHFTLTQTEVTLEGIKQAKLPQRTVVVWGKDAEFYQTAIGLQGPPTKPHRVPSLP